MNYDEIWEDCLRYKIQQKKSEFVELLTEIGTSENILEIGSYDGGSSIGFCNIAKNVTSINLNPKRV